MVKNLPKLPIEKYVKTYNPIAKVYTDKKCIRNAFVRLITFFLFSPWFFAA